MRTADMVKSKYWRGRDLEGQRPMILTIAHVTEEIMGRGAHGQDVKCFLWFQEHLKGLQLNKSRVLILEMAYGPDSELWIGKRVKLSYDPTVMFGDKPVGGVRLETPAGVVYRANGAAGAWGDAPLPPGAPPPPVWDANRQQWILPTPPPAAAPPPNRPPPPVWNAATQKWEFVDAQTGEINGAAGSVASSIAQPAQHQRPPTISERVNAGHPAPSDDGWGGQPPPTGQQHAPEFDDDIPF
jgi:hypothetical protein